VGYTLTVTTDPLGATLTPWRAAAQIQGKLYDLDIDRFLTAGTIGLTGVETDSEQNLIVRYVVAHPFPAPKVDQPITALNRADLSFTGRVLFINDMVGPLDPSPRFFFEGTASANTGVILNADHYVNPGDLLARTPDPFVSTFPAKLIVDETHTTGGNRIGVSNAEDPEGNYDPANGGWTREDLGATGTGWTGYDVLHAGQRAENRVVIGRASLGQGWGQFDIALLIKYTDPRGKGFAQDRNVRMPQEPPDPSIFAYRMPNGALDASKIEVDPSTGGRVQIGYATGAEADVTLLVRDWDARATETTEPVLQDDDNLAAVNIGTAGPPTLELDIPGVLTAPVTLSPGAQSGLPGDEIRYSGRITSAATVLPGPGFGMVRATDPENSAPGRSTYHFGVDPFTLVPNANRALEVITYQVVPIEFLDTNQAPACNSLAPTPGTIAPGGTFTLNLNDIGDPESDTMAIALRYTGPSESGGASILLTDAERAAETAFNPFTDPRLSVRLAPPQVPGVYTLHLELHDFVGQPSRCELSFTVSDDLPPACVWSINEPGPFSAPAEFTVNLAGITDPDSSVVNVRFYYLGPESSLSTDVLLLVADLGSESTFNPFTDPRLTIPLHRPTTPGRYSFAVEVRDGRSLADCGPFQMFTVE